MCSLYSIVVIADGPVPVGLLRLPNPGQAVVGGLVLSAAILLRAAIKRRTDSEAMAKGIIVSLLIIVSVIAFAVMSQN